MIKYAEKVSGIEILNLFILKRYGRKKLFTFSFSGDIIELVVKSGMRGNE